MNVVFTYCSKIPLFSCPFMIPKARCCEPFSVFGLIHRMGQHSLLLAEQLRVNWKKVSNSLRLNSSYRLSWQNLPIVLQMFFFFNSLKNRIRVISFHTLLPQIYRLETQICDVKHLNNRGKFLAKILVFTRVQSGPPHPPPEIKKCSKPPPPPTPMGCIIHAK